MKIQDTNSKAEKFQELQVKTVIKPKLNDLPQDLNLNLYPNFHFNNLCLTVDTIPKTTAYDPDNIIRPRLIYKGNVLVIDVTNKISDGIYEQVQSSDGTIFIFTNYYYRTKDPNYQVAVYKEVEETLRGI